MTVAAASRARLDAGTAARRIGRLLALLMVLPWSALAPAASLPAQPEDVGAYLVARESREPGIRPGTERTVRWAHGTPARTPLALVYLHGYSATRQEVAPLADRVAAALGANLFYTRLTGHGRDADAMLSGSVGAWQQDAREALAIGRVIGERVVLVSTSTGGTLSTWLAAEEPGDALAALVMISPNFAPRDRALYLFDTPLLAPLVLRWYHGEYRTWEPWNEQQARYWTWRYPYAALAELAKLMNVVERIDKSAISVPTLMIYSPADQVIDPDAVEETFAQWGGTRKELHAFGRATDPAQHVLAGDVLSPGTTEELAELIRAWLAQVVER